MERLFSVLKIQLEKQYRTQLIISGPTRLLLGRQGLSVMDVRKWWGRQWPMELVLKMRVKL